MGEIGFKFKKGLKDFQNLIPALTIIIAILGFGYFKSYYKYFGVEIEYYISLNDMLFIPIVLLLQVLVYSAIFMFFSIPLINILYRNLDKKFNFVGTGDNKFDRQDLEVSIYLVLIGLVFSFHFVFDDLDLVWPLYILPVMMARGFMIIYEISIGKDGRTQFLILVSLLIFGSFSLAGNKNAKMLTKKPKSIHINFVANEKRYSTTTDNYFFVGETNGNIFIYDKDNEATLVFLKTELREFYVVKIEQTFWQNFLNP